MSQRRLKNIRTSYFIILFLELLGEIIASVYGSSLLIYVVKPLLMLMLIFYYYKAIRPGGDHSMHRFVLGALVFSMLGDVLLMLPAGANLFVFGLLSFLMAHICYIVSFKKDLNKFAPSLSQDNKVAFIPIIAYCVGLVVLLMYLGNESFKSLKIPVIIYAAVIMVMVITALNRYKRVLNQSFILVFIGAILFTLSDSIIAINKFTNAFSNHRLLARLIIMALYGIGQFLIIQGIIERKRKR